MLFFFLGVGPYISVSIDIGIRNQELDNIRLLKKNKANIPNIPQVKHCSFLLLYFGSHFFPLISFTWLI